MLQRKLCGYAPEGNDNYEALRMKAGTAIEKTPGRIFTLGRVPGQEGPIASALGKLVPGGGLEDGPWAPGLHHDKYECHGAAPPPPSHHLEFCKLCWPDGV